MNADDYRNILDDLYGEPEPDDVKAVVVDYVIQDRVRLVGADELGSWGWVTAIEVRPNGIVYQVSWPTTRTDTRHYAFELGAVE